MSETFGQWLKQRREAAGYNRTELAARARTTKATISLYELDKVDQPRKAVVDNIAKALHVPLDEARIAAGYMPNSEIMGDPEGFYRDFDKLSPDARRLAKKQIKAIIEALAEEDDPDLDYIGEDDEEAK